MMFVASKTYNYCILSPAKVFTSMCKCKVLFFPIGDLKLAGWTLYLHMPKKHLVLNSIFDI